MAYLTQFSIPALLNPMINKMADEASAILLLICSHDVCVKVAYDGSTALCPCCAYVDPVFTCQSYDMSISTSTRRTNFRFFIFQYIFFSNMNMVIRSSNSSFCLCTEEPCIATTPFTRPPLASAHLP